MLSFSLPHEYDWWHPLLWNVSAYDSGDIISKKKKSRLFFYRVNCLAFDILFGNCCWWLLGTMEVQCWRQWTHMSVCMKFLVAERNLLSVFLFLVLARGFDPCFFTELNISSLRFFCCARYAGFTVSDFIRILSYCLSEWAVLYHFLIWIFEPSCLSGTNLDLGSRQSNDDSGHVNARLYVSSSRSLTWLLRFEISLFSHWPLWNSPLEDLITSTGLWFRHCG